ncbi:MAG: hypothetical protein GXX93_06695 [Anaerolineae bacterium]|nr:hypothetical protein [Anaerolineae bacterium]
MVRWGTGPALLSRPDLLTHDTRLPPERRHLSVSLLCLWDLLRQAKALGVGLYRVATALVPVATAADGSRFRYQLDACQSMLDWLRPAFRADGIRLTAHPLLQVQLGSDDDEVAQAGLTAAEAWGALWERLDPDGQALTVVHLGGGEPARAQERFRRRVDALGPAARKYLALENEDHGATLEQSLAAATGAGLPLVLDYLHLRCHNPAGLPEGEAVARALGTWPDERRPKLHFSSPETGQGRRPPQPRQHGDYLDPFSYLGFARLLPPGRDCDVMLEAKAKDLALIKLRRDLAALEERCETGAGVIAAG